jgi:hypothetical protein
MERLAVIRLAANSAALVRFRIIKVPILAFAGHYAKKR